MQRYFTHKKLLAAAMCFIFLSCSSGGGNNGDTGTVPFVPVEDDGAYIDTQKRLSITRFGITWLVYKDSETYEYGQFANGDYWVVGPVTIVGISPESAEVSGRVMHGSMVNPVPGSQQGYDSAIEGTYSADLNVGMGISSDPLDVQNGSSLISVISLANPESGADRPKLQTAAVLTILESVPDTGSFRPPYCGTDKMIRFNADDLDYNLLKSLIPVENTPALSDVESSFERVWLDHLSGWQGRALHPTENMPDYGSIMASEVSDGALMLHLNFTNLEKQTLLIRYIQLGIDNFGIIKSGGENIWEPDGGHCGGRKWPILFAGLMLNDTREGGDGMKDIGQKSGDYLYTVPYSPGNVPPDYIHFQEDGQTFYVTQDDVDLKDVVTNYHGTDFTGHFYPPEPVDLPEYAAVDIGMPEWGIRHSTYPLWDGNAWVVTYRAINAYSWVGFVLAARMMNANTSALWNHPALFDYEDRHMAVTASADLAPAWRSSVSYYGKWASQEGSWRATSRFMENMWDEYRDNY